MFRVFSRKNHKGQEKNIAYKEAKKKNQEMNQIEENLSTVSAFSPLNLCSEQ